jgi:hypothetical protein
MSGVPAAVSVLTERAHPLLDLLAAPKDQGHSGQFGDVGDQPGLQNVATCGRMQQFDFHVPPYAATFARK